MKIANSIFFVALLCCKFTNLEASEDSPKSNKSDNEYVAVSPQSIPSNSDSSPEDFDANQPPDTPGETILLDDGNEGSDVSDNKSGAGVSSNSNEGYTPPPKTARRLSFSSPKKKEPAKEAEGFKPAESEKKGFFQKKISAGKFIASNILIALISGMAVYFGKGDCRSMNDASSFGIESAYDLAKTQTWFKDLFKENQICSFEFDQPNYNFSYQHVCSPISEFAHIQVNETTPEMMADFLANVTSEKAKSLLASYNFLAADADLNSIVVGFWREIRNMYCRNEIAYGDSTIELMRSINIFFRRLFQIDDGIFFAMITKDMLEILALESAQGHKQKSGQEILSQNSISMKWNPLWENLKNGNQIYVVTDPHPLLEQLFAGLDGKFWSNQGSHQHQAVFEESQGKALNKILCQVKGNFSTTFFKVFDVHHYVLGCIL